MERLTKQDPFNKGYYGISSKLICNIKENGDWFDDGLFYTGIAVKKLAEYENTGLEPKEVEQLKVNQNKLAIEKLEYLSQFLKEKGFAGCDNNGSYNVSDIIKTMIAELKGEKYDTENR